jgi:ABC-2 type transport system permease protein
VTAAWLIARREWRAQLGSPLGVLVIASALLIDGLLLYWQGLSRTLLSSEVIEQFFFWTSGTTMIAAVVLSARAFAEERQAGTLVLLTTAPISDVSLVVGKFLSAFGVLALMTALTAYLPLMVLVSGKVSLGHLMVGYLGLLLLGSASVSIGLFASSLARSQVVAVVLAACIHAVLLLLWALAPSTSSPLSEVLTTAALHHQHQRAFSQGIVRLDAVLYYVAVSWFLLLATTKILEARRWK